MVQVALTWHIQQLAQQKGISRECLLALSGLSETILDPLWHGSGGNPCLQDLEAIAKSLDVSMKDLFDEQSA